ncbi:uncharacterized protein LOC135684538 [Rhopilema esculentum]|uniref:uncharacterized protein LOC135684538 n=1 Tax=Rhopilema esculentum TaxID=499914 RepID=UPI0031D65AFE
MMQYHTIFLIAVATGLAKGQDHVTCNRTYNKIGCFEEKSIVTTLLVNDRESGSDKSQGHTIDWTNIDKYLHSLACRCKVEAEKHGFKYFGIRYFGECYGGNAGTIDNARSSSRCFQGAHYGPCNDEVEAECGGQALADYVYSLKKSGEEDIDGGYSEWTQWSRCSQECGGGKMFRSRACDNPEPKGQGKDCFQLGNDTESANCGTAPCPVDGGFTEWSLFGACSKTCGGGIMTRTRNCTNPEPANGGKDCDGATVENKACNEQACPVNGGFSEWSDFGSCSVTCGTGIHRRERSCNNPPPSNGGLDCTGPYIETKECDAGGCPINGGYGEWKAVGECSKLCGEGEQTFQRECDNPMPQNGGANCFSIGPAEEKRVCNTHPCPIDGGFSEWSRFSNCSVLCGIGFKYRSRQCNNPAPENGGKDCEGELTEAAECNPIHCKGNLAYHKSTKQSSTLYGGDPSRATDGIKTANFGNNSCTLTRREIVPWWRVDLGARHRIGNIRITNRGDCCASRLKRIDIRVNDADNLDGELCTHYPGTFGAGETKTLYCSTPLTGQYVYVWLKGEDHLTLCEVEVFSPDPTNLARGKPSKQSSTAIGGPSSGAVDGNKDSNFRHGSCTQTLKEHNPWWRVDLGATEPVGEIAITNRGDCCSDKLRNVEIRVGNNTEGPSKNQMCIYNHGAVGSGERRTFYCENVITGRFVYITLRAEEQLTLCEVEVFKANLENYARGKPTRQSSTSHSGSSERAVDGNPHSNYGGGSCTHTNREPGAWWRVDLLASKTVGKIAIVNRADCCSKRLKQVEIRVGETDSPDKNTLCHYHELPFLPGIKTFIHCSKPTNGRYVFIKLKGSDHLTLCEVEVYALKPGEKVDGGLTPWSEFSACSASCGGGAQYSTRSCTNPYPANGGISCVGDTRRSSACNTHSCPVNGGLSEWSSWGKCNAQCGAGQQYRTRSCNNPSPSHGGFPCRGVRKQPRPCQSRPCPVDGGYGPWTRYKQCSVTCGLGFQVRTRECNNPKPAHGGKSCKRLGTTFEMKYCRRPRCPMPVSPPFYHRVCEHGTLNIACPVGSNIRIMRALYGRTTRAYCKRGWWTSFYHRNCRARRSNRIVKSRCNRKRACSVPAKNWLFGDPCFGTFKYLEVVYRCFGTSAPHFNVRLCEHMNKVISCPFGRRLKIDYAMYGRLSRRHCSTYAPNLITNCSATSSLVKTKAMCDGRTWCVLSARNGVYGDPCVGVYKYLNVRYRCI